MGAWFETILDLSGQQAALRQGRYGVVEAGDGRFARIELRPFPKLVLLPEIWFGRLIHRRRPGDRCWIYYNQPRSSPSYLAVTYFFSLSETRLATVDRALEALDEVARIKQTDALVCDAMNDRLSERLLHRHGWEAHCPSCWHRHFIKRFYGQYAPTPAWVS